MERIKYIFIFAIILLVFKAMFLDDYLKKSEMAENNISTPTEAVDQVSAAPIVEENTTVQSAPPPPPAKAEKKELPLDKIGNSIADKINL